MAEWGWRGGVRQGFYRNPDGTAKFRFNLVRIAVSRVTVELKFSSRQPSYALQFNVNNHFDTADMRYEKLFLTFITKNTDQPSLRGLIAFFFRCQNNKTKLCCGLVFFIVFAEVSIFFFFAQTRYHLLN